MRVRSPRKCLAYAVPTVRRWGYIRIDGDRAVEPETESARSAHRVFLPDGFSRFHRARRAMRIDRDSQVGESVARGREALCFRKVHPLCLPVAPPGLGLSFEIPRCGIYT